MKSGCQSGLAHTVSRVVFLMVVSYFHGRAIADLSDQEALLLARRRSLDHLYIRLRTEGLVGERFLRLSDYWISDECFRHDTYLDGTLAGLYYREFWTPEKQCFFTNQTDAAGRAVVAAEVRSGSSRASPSTEGDPRRLGLGIGVVSQLYQEHLLWIGRFADAERKVVPTEFDGEQCDEIKWSSGAHGISVIVRKHRGWEPARVVWECAAGSTGQRHVVSTSTRAFEGPGGTRVFFPARVEIWEFDNEVLVRRAVEIVEKLEFGRPDNAVFTLAGLDLPVGHRVYDFERHALGRWDGRRVVLDRVFIEGSETRRRRSLGRTAALLSLFFILAAATAHLLIRTRVHRAARRRRHKPE